MRTPCGRSSSSATTASPASGMSQASLGNGLGKLAGRVFRIGHLGDFNDLMLAGTLSGIEMGLHQFGVPLTASGVAAALQHLSTPRRDDQHRASAA